MLKLCTIFFIAGKIGEVFKLAIWRSRKKIAKNLLILNPVSPAGNYGLHQYCLPTPLRMWYWGFFSLSGKEIVVANESMRHTLGEANCAPTCSLNSRTRGEGEDGKVCYQKQPS